MTAPLSLKKCLEAVLEKSVAKRYLRSIDTISMPSRFYYNTALRELNSKNSEGAIHNIILSLCAEPNFEPSLHLIKTMLFGLSKKFHESGGEVYKQRYGGNLTNCINFLEKSIADNDREILKLRNDQSREKEKGFWLVIQKIFFKKSLKNYSALIQEINIKKEDLKKQLNTVIKMSQIEEYAKVLSVVLEISLYPARYAWVVA